jgi:hypothetical protein
MSRKTVFYQKTACFQKSLISMKYMVIFKFDRRDESAFKATIPAEQAYVQKLLNEGVIEGIYVALDGTRGWDGFARRDTRTNRTNSANFSSFPLYEHRACPTL